MSLEEKGRKTLELINLKLEEAKQLKKCYPRLEKNKWFFEQLDKLVDLALETEKILEKAKGAN